MLCAPQGWNCTNHIVSQFCCKNHQESYYLAWYYCATSQISICMHCLQVCILHPNVQTVALVLVHLDLTSTAWFSFVPHHQCIYTVYALLLGLMQTNSHFWILHFTVLSKLYSDCVIHHCESNQFQGSFLKVVTVSPDVFAVLFEISIVHQKSFCIIKSICDIWSLDWVCDVEGHAVPASAGAGCSSAWAVLLAGSLCWSSAWASSDCACVAFLPLPPLLGVFLVTGIFLGELLRFKFYSTFDII